MAVIQGDRVTLTDGATVATDVSLGDYFDLSGFRPARTISAPTNGVAGELISYRIENTGGACETTWDPVFVLAGPWTDPSPDRARSITFSFDGTHWIEMSRTGADLKLIAFDPAEVASLEAWYDANALADLADGGAVSDWPARVGVDPAASSGHEPTLKTGIQNGRPIVRFDGTDDWLSVSNPLYGEQSCSIFAVLAKGNTSGGIRTLADFGGTGTNGLIAFEGDTTGDRTLWQYGKGSGIDSNLASSVGTAFHQWSWIVPTGSQPSLYKDAGSAIAPTGAGNSGFAALSQAALYVGSNGGTSRFMNGDLAELLVYSTALSGSDRAAVATYLKNKWGTP